MLRCLLRRNETSTPPDCSGQRTRLQYTGSDRVADAELNGKFSCTQAFIRNEWTSQRASTRPQFVAAHSGVSAHLWPLLLPGHSKPPPAVARDWFSLPLGSTLCPATEERSYPAGARFACRLCLQQCPASGEIQLETASPADFSLRTRAIFCSASRIATASVASPELSDSEKILPSVSGILAIFSSTRSRS